jgi:hypothetical protein
VDEFDLGGNFGKEGLWGLAFRSEGGSLSFTAGPNDENHGLLGVLRVEGAGNRKDD